MITIDNLHFRYPGKERPALKGINLLVQPNSLFGLLGPNGAGKTTLLSILTGLLPCQSGKVLIDGMDAACSDLASKRALVPQEYAFYNRLTVTENLRFFAGTLGFKARELSLRLTEVVEVTGLERYLDARADTLSGGLKRRLNLAIGLLARPALLLLDEPTVSIDPHSRHFILEAIRKLNQQGTTIVYTSHYLEEVEALCDQIAIIDDGQVLLQGPLRQILQAKGNAVMSVDLCDLPSDADISALRQELDFTQFQQRLDIQLQNNSDSGEINNALGVLASRQMGVSRVHYGPRNLEELFLDLTERSLRD